MKRIEQIRHEFTDIIPEDLEEGVLYVSMKYATAIHLCFCGCGNKVVTLIRPTRWQLAFDGKSVSLTPSIGNWGFQCKSHYWIRHNQVDWAGTWSKKEIDGARRREHEELEHEFECGQSLKNSGQVVKGIERHTSLRMRLERLFTKRKS
ncbi:hypothetical protein GALL_323490 [mine drainage metagenome]|uniref:Uncharacterized protein n=1 Tax=mine drainage metagenome TaxID=410659 RepID=A0A1J5QQX3_9ZZZZ